MHITGSVTLPTDLRSLLQLFIHINSAFAFGVSITLATVWQPSPLLMRAAILQRQIQKFLKGGGWGGGVGEKEITIIAIPTIALTRKH